MTPNDTKQVGFAINKRRDPDGRTGISALARTGRMASIGDRTGRSVSNRTGMRRRHLSKAARRSIRNLRGSKGRSRAIKGLNKMKNVLSESRQINCRLPPIYKQSRSNFGRLASFHVETDVAYVAQYSGNYT